MLGRRGSYLDAYTPLIAHRAVVAADDLQVARREAELDLALFTGRDGDALEGLQLALGLYQRRLQMADVM